MRRPREELVYGRSIGGFSRRRKFWLISSSWARSFKCYGSASCVGSVGRGVVRSSRLRVSKLHVAPLGFSLGARFSGPSWLWVGKLCNGWAGKPTPGANFSSSRCHWERRTALLAARSGRSWVLRTCRTRLTGAQRSDLERCASKYAGCAPVVILTDWLIGLRTSDVWLTGALLVAGRLVVGVSLVALECVWSSYLSTCVYSYVKKRAGWNVRWAHFRKFGESHVGEYWESVSARFLALWSSSASMMR